MPPTHGHPYNSSNPAPASTPLHHRGGLEMVAGDLVGVASPIRLGCTPAEAAAKKAAGVQFFDVSQKGWVDITSPIYGLVMGLARLTRSASGVARNWMW